MNLPIFLSVVTLRGGSEITPYGDEEWGSESSMIPYTEEDLSAASNQDRSTDQTFQEEDFLEDFPGLKGLGVKVRPPAVISSNGALETGISPEAT